MGSRRRLSCALALGAVLLAPAAAAARPAAVIAFVEARAAQDLSLLDDFRRAGMSVGFVSAVTGGWDPRQMAVDVSQGARLPTRLYDRDLPALALRDGHVAGWSEVVRRAAGAPADLTPGLFAATLSRAGVPVAYIGDGRSAAAAADRRGRVRVTSAPVPGGVTVVDLRAGELGRLAAAPADALVIAVQAPSGKRLRLMPAAMSGAGAGLLRSATTRRDGLVAATDIAPTVLRHLGLEVPEEMEGRQIERVGDPDLGALRGLAARLDVVTDRRGPALLAFAALLLVSLGLRRRRLPLLAVLWLPALALLAAALRPSAPVEVALLAAGPLLLALATDRLVPWPRGPWLPAAVSALAHAIDLARGSDLIGQAVTGPNPAGGARFYGIGNELEILLSLSVLLGTGAWLARKAVPGTARAAAAPEAVPGTARAAAAPEAVPGTARAAAEPEAVPGTARAAAAPEAVPGTGVAFAVAGAGAALVMGAGRLGADVGAVITLGAGTAAAVVASLPGRPSRRAVAMALLAPAAAVALLALVDLVTGGDSHFAESVLGADGGGELGEVVQRRLEGSLSGLGKPGAIAATVIAAALLARLAARRSALAGHGPPAAALVGCWFAVVAGAIGNDSGPLILWVGAAVTGLAAFYAKSVRDGPES